MKRWTLTLIFLAATVTAQDKNSSVTVDLTLAGRSIPQMTEGFAMFLERGGMGSARKLAGQFYFTDLSVLKLMFSAILTAMLGLFWLSWAGLLDLSRVYVPETFVAPQLVGGVVFGVGFATPQ